jgi:prepilin-type N-terminal cleavage/methylation domain-containing protein
MKLRKGFTLIELLVVIAIIGLLSTLAVVALNSARAKARDAKRISDVNQIRTALELYLNDQQAYPVAASPITLGDDTHDCLAATTAAGFVDNEDTDDCASPYMGLVPSNPTPNGAAYQYTSANGSTYSLTFSLEGVTGGLPAGAHTATPDAIQ